MSRIRRERSVWLLLSAAIWLGSCYDTPLIPDDSRSVAGGGAAGAGGAPLSSAGKAGKTSAGSNASAGNAQAGSPPQPSAGAGGGGSGGKPGEGGDAGQAGEPTGPGVRWLELAGDLAPSTSEPNQELGIQGSFYAYADSCATLSWDAETRCVSGRLCNPHVTPDAWGMAIGFDFHDTGESGTPPNTKLTWNPNEHGALGLAWRVSGAVKGLQVWVLNMDSSWSGQCDVMNCEIAGPPDGDDAVALNGELLFSGMRKDDWGGSGVAYDFNPAAVHALQFKLPAIRELDAEFDFCLDALGVIR